MFRRVERLRDCGTESGFVVAQIFSRMIGSGGVVVVVMLRYVVRFVRKERMRASAGAESFVGKLIVLMLVGREVWLFGRPP